MSYVILHDVVYDIVYDDVCILIFPFIVSHVISYSISHTTSHTISLTTSYNNTASRTALYPLRYVPACTSTYHLVLPCTRGTGFQMLSSGILRLYPRARAWPGSGYKAVRETSKSVVHTSTYRHKKFLWQYMPVCTVTTGMYYPF